MPAPGSVWGSGVWGDDVWGANVWGNAATAPVVTPTVTGKYRPEHDSAFADISATTGFNPEHAGAYRDITEAGS